MELPDDQEKEEKASEIDRMLVEEMQRVIPDVRIGVEGHFMRRWKKG